jgi:hypothetical protein
MLHVDYCFSTGTIGELATGTTASSVTPAHQPHRSLATRRLERLLLRTDFPGISYGLGEHPVHRRRSTPRPGCGTEHGGRRAPRRFLIDDRHIGLGEFRFVYPPVHPVSLIPHLLQRDVAALTHRPHLDAAKPVTRVFDDEHRLRADGHRASPALTPRRQAPPRSRRFCMSRTERSIPTRVVCALPSACRGGRALRSAASSPVLNSTRRHR